MLPEYIIIHGSESPLGQKCHDLVKDYNFPFKKLHFWLFKGFKGQIEVPRQFLQYNTS